jgi:Fe-S-cluster containining protein
VTELVQVRRLPVLPGAVVPGAEHLDFRCNGCGACCRVLRVTVTHHDLRRLAHGLGRAVVSLVDWLPPDAVDMTGEPGSFVELGSGRRLMVLAQDGGACRLLDAAERCSAYEHRPHDCRLFPFDLTRDERGALASIARLPLDGCSDERGEVTDAAELSAWDERRWDELRDYQAAVERWNRLARHRRRFRRRVGGSADFLSWLGFGEPFLGSGKL